MKVDENEAGKPSAEDLDAVAAEQKSAEATSGEQSEGAKQEQSGVEYIADASDPTLEELKEAGVDLGAKSSEDTQYLGATGSVAAPKGFETDRVTALENEVAALKVLLDQHGIRPKE
jgi:hypothetical protein